MPCNLLCYTPPVRKVTYGKVAGADPIVGFALERYRNLAPAPIDPAFPIEYNRMSHSEIRAYHRFFIACFFASRFVKLGTECRRQLHELRRTPAGCAAAAV